MLLGTAEDGAAVDGTAAVGGGVDGTAFDGAAAEGRLVVGFAVGFADLACLECLQSIMTYLLRHI